MSWSLKTVWCNVLTACQAAIAAATLLARRVRSQEDPYLVLQLSQPSPAYSHDCHELSHAQVVWGGSTEIQNSVVVQETAGKITPGATSYSGDTPATLGASEQQCRHLSYNGKRSVTVGLVGSPSQSQSLGAS